MDPGGVGDNAVDAMKGEGIWKSVHNRSTLTQITFREEDHTEDFENDFLTNHQGPHTHWKVYIFLSLQTCPRSLHSFLPSSQICNPSLLIPILS